MTPGFFYFLKKQKRDSGQGPSALPHSPLPRCFVDVPLIVIMQRGGWIICSFVGRDMHRCSKVFGPLKRGNEITVVFIFIYVHQHLRNKFPQAVRAVTIISVAPNAVPCVLRHMKYTVLDQLERDVSGDGLSSAPETSLSQAQTSIHT